MKYRVDHGDVRVTSVRFQELSLSLQHMNVLVGPNNSGKSTVLGAFQLLSAGLQRAFARKAEAFVGPGGSIRYGYRIAEDAIPLSLENVHTDYSDQPATIVFRLSNGNHLVLYMPEERECYLLAQDVDSYAKEPKNFKRVFPISVVVVPVLGPVEHEKPLFTAITVKRGCRRTGLLATFATTGTTIRRALATSLAS